MALGIPVLIKYPFYSEEDGQLFPYKTLSMLVTLSCILLFSFVTKYVFEHGILPARMDVFMCVVSSPDEAISLRYTDVSDSVATPVEEKGKINPALKFSSDDLLTVKSDVHNQTDGLIHERKGYTSN